MVTLVIETSNSQFQPVTQSRNQNKGYSHA